MGKKNILFFVVLLAGSISLYAQTGYWNLVWREDFGVTADTVVRDFADDSKQVIDHTCAASESECTTINDMYYGIANSTWWAYNRYKSCSQEAWHFMGGRDHTGNDKGAMLIVNVGNNSLDKQIYEQTINFDLCQNSVYRFVIYAASITNPDYCDASPTLSNLTMNVYNVKDPSNPILIKTLETGDIPLWQMPLKDNGEKDWGTTNNGFGDPFGERQWSEYSVEFTAGDGDKLQLEVINHKNGGCGNDFVIDDISLYRYDTDDIIDPTISTNTLSQESSASATGCSYYAQFSVPSDVLESWKRIYNQVYFLWQRSTDDGYTWSNMTSVSGIDKTSIEWEVNAEIPEVYRVIITGATSSVDAKAEAEYIAANGGPSNGCSYFSISNTLAGVSPEPDCSYRADLKTIWKEDFGVIDSSITRTFDGIGSEFTFFESPNETKFEDLAPAYVVTCAPDSLAHVYYNWDKTETYYEYKEPALDKYTTPEPNGGVLYVRPKGSTTSLIVDKVITGPFCNCKNYMFNFSTMALSTWTEMRYTVMIKDGSGNVLASESYQIWGEGTPTMKTFTVPFTIPTNYTGNIRVQIQYDGNQNWAVPVMFDDLSVTICQEKLPQVNLYIDSNESLRYVSNFDCSATPPHIASLTDMIEWKDLYANYGYVWQSSTDGGTTWTNLSETGLYHQCEDLVDGETLFRVVIAETKAVALQVAANGKPTDPCSDWFITNTVGFSCKGVTCEEPADITISSSDEDNVLCPSGTATLTPTAQADATTFAQEWYKDGVLLAGYPLLTDQAVYTASDAGTYMVKVYDSENPLARCTKTAEITITSAPNPTVSITGGAEYCAGDAVSPVSFAFTGTAPYTFSYTNGTTETSNVKATTSPYTPTKPTAEGTYTYKVTALSDAYCTASSLTSSSQIQIKPVPSAVAENDGPVCEGTPLNLSGSSDQASANYAWSGPNSYTSTAQNPVLTSTTKSMSGTYTLTTTLNGCSSTTTTAVTIKPKPVVSLSAEPTTVCSGVSSTVTATITNDGTSTGTYTWSNAIGSGNTATFTKTVTTTGTQNVSLNYSNDGCSADVQSVQITVKKIPATPSDVKVSYCVNQSPDEVSDLISVANDGASLQWYNAGGATINAPTISTTSPLDVTYYVSEILDGCESEKASFTIVVNSNLSPEITIDDADLCIGDVARLNLAQSFDVVEWLATYDGVTYLDGTAIANPKFTAPTVTEEKTYTVGVKVTDQTTGCEGTNTSTITVHPKPTVTLSASQSAICDQTSTTITASPSSSNGTGEWTGAEEQTELTALFTANGSGTSSVTYVYTDQNECKSDPESIDIVVNAIPQAPGVTSLKYCLNDVATPLTATATGTLTWYDSDKNPLQTAPTPSTADAKTLTYFVTQTENGCESEFAQLDVIVNPLPIPVITASSDAVCANNAISLGLTETYRSQQWSCSPSDYLNSLTIASPTFQATASAGNYTVTVSVTDANSCVNTATKDLTVYPIPSVTLSNLTNQCASVSDVQNITATVMPEGTDGVGTWGTPAVKVDDFSAQFIPQDAGAGTYTITYDFVSDKQCIAEQVSTEVTVYPLPNVTLTPSKTDVCQGGNNSDVVTMKTTGTTTDGTFVYSSATLTGLQSASGSFNPSSETAMTHTIQLTYTDENSCEAQASTSVTIHARPVADVSMNQTEYCDYDADATLLVSIDNVSSSLGTFSGIGVSASSFSPSTAGAGGPYTVSYTYTDAVTQCSAEPVNFDITVYHTDAPQIVSTSESKLNVTSQATVPEITATGTDVQWFLSSTPGEASVATGTSYAVTYVDSDSDGNMDVDVYTVYATQTLNGCESDFAEGTLTITDCSVKAPTAVKYHACEGDNSITVEAVSQATTSDNFGWFENRNDIPSGTVASLADANPLGTGAQYVMDLSGYSAGTYTMYVAEYDGTVGTECFSPATAVTVEVHAKPTPVIDDPGMICSTESSVQITYSPGEGSTLSGEGLSSDIWTPQFDNTQTGVTETVLTLVSEKQWGTGTDVSATCSATQTRTLSVTHVLAPTGTGIGDSSPLLWSIGSIASLPSLEVDYAEALGATLTIKDSEATTIGTAQPLSLYPDYVSAIGTYSFYVTQTLNGCESPIAESLWKIVECPTPTPNPESVTLCAGDALPTLSANGTGSPSYEWLDEEGNLISTEETLDVASLTGYESIANTYTFKVRQDGLDAAGNTCWGDYATVSVIINQLPTVEIADIPVLCYDGGDYEVQATMNGSRSTQGSWSIDGSTTGISTTGIISPTFGGMSDATYTITYEVLDENQCKNSATKEFSIEYAEKPQITAYAGIITDPKPVELTAENIENNAVVRWYVSSDVLETVYEGNPYTTDDDPEQEITTSYWVSQKVNGCESERVEYPVQIVNCPWTVAAYVPASACRDDAVTAMTATADASASVSAWKWVDEEGTVVSTTDSYTQSSTATAGVFKYYASYEAYEPISGKNCWSKPQEVITEIYELPEITFSETSSTICYTTTSERIEFSVSSENGTGVGEWQMLDGESSAIENGIFYPQANGMTSGTYKIQYTYTDAKSCRNSQIRSVSVLYLEKPETKDFYAMTSQSNPVVVEVVSVPQSGSSIEWFSTETAKTNPLAVGLQFDTQIDKTKPVETSFYARQHDGACYSEPQKAQVKIVACPIPSVSIDDAVACIYEDIPVLSATTGGWSERDASSSEFRFYTTESSVSPENVSNDGTYQPSISQAGTYSYFVSEYNAVPLANLTVSEGCEGPRVQVEIVIKETASPVITASLNPASVCFGEANPTYTATGTTIQWFEENPGIEGVPQVNPVYTGISYTPTESEVGTHSLWAVAFVDNCYSPSVESVYEIKALPSAPIAEDKEICYGELSVPLIAQGESTATYVWYADETLRAEVQKGSAEYTSKEIDPDSYDYFVTQIVNACAGPATKVVYTIKPLPLAPQVDGQPNLCDYDEAPTLTAYGENITWYASDKTTKIGEGETFLAPDNELGSHSYYASQTVLACEGPLAIVSYSVNKQPATPIVTGASICYGDTVMPVLKTNLGIDVWYADAATSEMLAVGFTYTPDYESVKGRNDTVRYYVQREQNNCLSEVVPVPLTIIPQPDFSIGDNIIACIYDSVQRIHATDFSPSITESSYVGWTVSVGRKSYAVVDNTEHYIQPSDIINEPGTYTINAYYRYKYENVACNSESKEITYTVKPRPRTPIVFTQTICQGEEINDLQALGTPNMVWQSLSGVKPERSVGYKYKFDKNQQLDTGSYSFVIFDVDYYDVENNLGCESLVDTVSMIVAPSAQTKIFKGDGLDIELDSVCVGSTELYYTQYTDESTYMWSVTGNNINYSKDNMSSSVRYVDWLNSGFDTLVVYERTWAGCEGFDTVLVKVATRPEPKFTWSLPGSSNIIELADATIQDSLWYMSAEGDTTKEAITYTMYWNLGHQGENPDIIDLVVPYEKRNTSILEEDYVFGYNCPTLTVTNSFGCTESYTECIFVNILTSLFVPDAFAPTNPSHEVRSFQPKGFNLKTCEISVYDKWGNMLWFSNEVEDGMFVGKWDGTYDGKMMKADVYIWKMEATFLDGQVWEGFDAGNGKKAKYGSVMLVR